MRKGILCACALFALAASAQVRADTFDARFAYQSSKESPSRSVSIDSEPQLSVTEALRIVPLMLTIVAQLDRIADSRSGALQAHLHTGGSWDAVMLWSVPVRRWTVIFTADDGEFEDSEPVPVAKGTDSRSQLALYRADRIEISTRRQEVSGMIHIPHLRQYYRR